MQTSHRADNTDNLYWPFVIWLWSSVATRTCRSCSRAPEITPSFLMGFVLLIRQFSMLCVLLLSVCLFNFWPWRCQFMFDLWVWLSLWYLSSLFHKLISLYNHHGSNLRMDPGNGCSRRSTGVLREEFLACNRWKI